MLKMFKIQNGNQVDAKALPHNHSESKVPTDGLFTSGCFSDEGLVDGGLANGWLLELNGKKLFFAGDTGYSAHFSDIKQKYGTIDVCLLPIASYHDETDGDWYRYVHTTPEDALSAAADLGCKLMIPWGYGNASWKMGDLSSHAPLQRLLTMKQQLQHLPQGQVPLLILNEGEFVKL